MNFRNEKSDLSCNGLSVEEAFEKDRRRWLERLAEERLVEGGGRRTEPIGAAYTPHYSKMRAEDFVRRHALSNRGRPEREARQSRTGISSPVRTIVGGLLELVGSQEAKGERFEARCVASSGPRGPLYRAVITSKVTKCAPSSGAPISAGDWYQKQTRPHEVARNGEPKGLREDTEPAKKAQARRPVYGAMVIPSRWPQK